MSEEFSQRLLNLKNSKTDAKGSVPKPKDFECDFIIVHNKCGLIAMEVKGKSDSGSASRPRNRLKDCVEQLQADADLLNVVGLLIGQSARVKKIALLINDTVEECAKEMRLPDDVDLWAMPEGGHSKLDFETFCKFWVL